MKYSGIVILAFLGVGLSGCLQMELTSDYRSKETIVAYSVLNSIENAPADKTYFDERLVVTGQYGTVDQNGFVNKLADRGYLMVYGSNIQLPKLTKEQVALIRKGDVPQVMRDQPYDYSLVMEIGDQSAAVSLEPVIVGVVPIPVPTPAKQLQLFIAIIDNKKSSIVWTTSVNDTESIFTGWINAMFIKDYHMNRSLNSAINNAFSDCPLLKEK